MTATKSYMPNLELCASATWILLASATHAHISQLFTFVEIKGVAAKTAGGLGVCMYVLSLFLVFGMAYDDLRHARRSIPKKAMYAYICYIIIFIFLIEVRNVNMTTVVVVCLIRTEVFWYILY